MDAKQFFTGPELCEQWGATATDLKWHIRNGLKCRNKDTLTEWTPTIRIGGSSGRYSIEKIIPMGEALAKLDLLSDVVYLCAEVEEYQDKNGIHRKGTAGEPAERRTPKKRDKRASDYAAIREEARKIAKEKWGRDPEATIRDMSQWVLDQLKKRSSLRGREVTLDTIRGYIKDLCPNRNPGRRSQK